MRTNYIHRINTNNSVYAPTKKGGFEMPLNSIVLASKISLISIPAIIILVGLFWLYMEL